MKGSYWLRQSILNCFEYRRAENLLGFTLDEMGATPREVFVLSRDETVVRCGLMGTVENPSKEEWSQGFNLRSAHPPDIILEYPPAGHRKVDEWHYAETRCAPARGARRNSLTAATQDFRL